MTQRSLELQVGALILVAAVLLGAFVLVMGGISFEPSYKLFVDFDNPAGIQGGSPVRIAGLKVGKIDEIQYRGGQIDPATGRREPLVRLRLSLEKRYGGAIHDNAVFYVTTQGVLGEQFLQIDPGSADRPLLAEGAVVRGIDPPRLDMLLAESFELLHTGVTALRENRQQIAEMFHGLHDTLIGAGEFLNKNGGKLDRITGNVEQLSGDADALVRAARDRYVDNPQIARILDRLDKTSETMATDAAPLLHDAREAMANLTRASKAIGAPDQQAKIAGIVSDLSEITRHLKSTTEDAEAIVSHVRRGNGSVGALIMDEQVYDDVQEMVRDLKHNPWKFFWRE